MSPREYAAKHTHREHKTWLAYLEDQHNPDLIHEYLAQLACEVRRVLHSKPNDVHHNDFHLKLVKVEPDREPTPEEIKARSDLSKSMWIGAVVGQGTAIERTISREEYEDTSCPLPEN